MNTKQRPSPFSRRKIFSRFTLGTAHPFVAKVLQLHDRHARFPGQAFHKIRLARADRTAEEIAHRQRLHIIHLPQLDVLAQPRLEALLRVKVVEGALRFDELDEARRVFFDELLAHRHEVVSVQHFACVRFDAQQILDGRQRGAGELMGERVVGRRELGDDSGMLDREQLQRIAQFVGRRQWHFDRRGARMIHEQRMQIVEILGDEERGQRVSRELIVRCPIAHEHGQRAEVVVERTGQGRSDEMRRLHEEADLIGIVSESGQVGRVAKEARQPFGGGARRSRQLGTLLVRRPLGDDLAPFLDAHPIAEVIAEDHVEAGQDHAREELVQIPERARIEQVTVVDVAVQQKLIRSMRLIQRHEPGGPRGEWHGGH
jgi:hypothetical protein